MSRKDPVSPAKAEKKREQWHEQEKVNWAKKAITARTHDLPAEKR